MTLEAADTGDSDGEGAAGDHEDDEDEDEDGEAEDMEEFQESGLLDEVDPVILYPGVIVLNTFLLVYWWNTGTCDTLRF